MKHGFEKISKKDLHSLIKAYNLHHAISNYTKYKVKDLRNVLAARFVLQDGVLYERSDVGMEMPPPVVPKVALTVDDFDWGSDDDVAPVQRPPPPSVERLPRVRAMPRSLPRAKTAGLQRLQDVVYKHDLRNWDNEMRKRFKT
jgi:hypothetical protein